MNRRRLLSFLGLGSAATVIADVGKAEPAKIENQIWFLPDDKDPKTWHGQYAHRGQLMIHLEGKDWALNQSPWGAWISRRDGQQA